MCKYKFSRTLEEISRWEIEAVFSLGDFTARAIFEIIKMNPIYDDIVVVFHAEDLEKEPSSDIQRNPYLQETDIKTVEVFKTDDRGVLNTYEISDNEILEVLLKRNK